MALLRGSPPIMEHMLLAVTGSMKGLDGFWMSRPSELNLAHHPGASHSHTGERTRTAGCNMEGDCLANTETEAEAEGKMCCTPQHWGWSWRGLHRGAQQLVGGRLWSVSHPCASANGDQLGMGLVSLLVCNRGADAVDDEHVE